MAKIITIANQKGGVGKTTTTLGLGAVLEEKGYKVLYVDLDKQCNTSRTLRADTSNSGSFEILANKTNAKELIQVTSNNSNVISASDKLDEVDIILNNPNNSLGKEYRLKNSLKEVKEYFDFILIDTPPNLNNATINALTTTDYLLIVSNADTFAIEGINYLLNMCESVKEYTNPNLELGGIVITRYNGRSVLSKDLKDNLDDLAKRNNTKVYKTFIRENIAIRESQTLREKLTAYAPKSNGALDYLELANEILEDLKA